MKKLILILTFLPISLFAQQPTNIIYIMSDDHDADGISAYNNPLSTPPILIVLLRKGCFSKKPLSVIPFVAPPELHC